MLPVLLRHRSLGSGSKDRGRAFEIVFPDFRHPQSSGRSVQEPCVKLFLNALHDAAYPRLVGQAVRPP